jgi:hypothetical protein
MHAVVNHLRFGEPIDPALFAGAKDDLAARMRAIGGFDAFHVIQTSDRDAILVIVAADAQTLDRIATEVGSPWMRANVVPLLVGPPERQLGPVIASTQYP